MPKDIMASFARPGWRRHAPVIMGTGFFTGLIVSLVTGEPIWGLFATICMGEAMIYSWDSAIMLLIVAGGLVGTAVTWIPGRYSTAPLELWIMIGAGLVFGFARIIKPSPQEGSSST